MANGLQPETLNRAVLLCFREAGDVQVIEIKREDAQRRCNASFTIDEEQFYLSVTDDAVDDCADAEAIAERLTEYNTLDVVQSMPNFWVSVTNSGCILGLV